MDGADRAAHALVANGSRLGQTKDVLIKRFCFKATIEERIDRLHGEMRKGKVQVTNGRLPPAGITLLAYQANDPAVHFRRYFGAA